MGNWVHFHNLQKRINSPPVHEVLKLEMRAKIVIVISLAILSKLLRSTVTISFIFQFSISFVVFSSDLFILANENRPSIKYCLIIFPSDERHSYWIKAAVKFSKEHSGSFHPNRTMTQWDEKKKSFKENFCEECIYVRFWFMRLSSTSQFHE